MRWGQDTRVSVSGKDVQTVFSAARRIASALGGDCFFHCNDTSTASRAAFVAAQTK